MKWTRLAVIALAGSLALAGCSSHQETASKPVQDQQKAQSVQKETSSSTDVKTGVTRMLSLTGELKKQIDAKDTAKIKTIGPQLEETWGSFEDGVKPKYPDLYAEVEKSLDPLVAGCQAGSFDQETLTKLNDQLIQALEKLEQKVK